MAAVYRKQNRPRFLLKAVLQQLVGCCLNFVTAAVQSTAQPKGVCHACSWRVPCQPCCPTCFAPLGCVARLRSLDGERGRSKCAGKMGPCSLKLLAASHAVTVACTGTTAGPFSERCCFPVLSTTSCLGTLCSLPTHTRTPNQWHRLQQ